MVAADAKKAESLKVQATQLVESPSHHSSQEYWFVSIVCPTCVYSRLLTVHPTARRRVSPVAGGRSRASKKIPEAGCIET